MTSSKVTGRFRLLFDCVCLLKNVAISQSVSLVLSKLRMRYKGDHKCRRAADMGLTLLPLNLTVLHITRTFLSTSWGCAWSDIYYLLMSKVTKTRCEVDVVYLLK